MNCDAYPCYCNKISDTLIWRITTKTGIDKECIVAIFNDASKKKYKLLNVRPETRYNDLSHILNQQELESLTLRYYIPLICEGHFLAMDRELYHDLARSSRLPVLECYASPYNNILKNYCSLFPQDKICGAFPRFDTFINNVKFPCRLILNPPYTVNAIKICINKVIEYMSRERGEFIAFLPLMYSFPEINNLLTYGVTQHVLLQGGTYSLYSFATNTDILNPSMQLYVIANISGSAQESHRIVNDIAYHLRNKAMTIKD
jgi:hypothetical protein